MKQVTEQKLYIEIKEILLQARQKVYRSVNFAMVLAYWEIGKRIIEHEQQGKKRAGYGDALIKELSARLMKDFGNGYAERNLRYFRQFDLVFSGSSIIKMADKKTEIRNAVRSESKNSYTLTIDKCSSSSTSC